MVGEAAGARVGPGVGLATAGLVDVGAEVGVAAATNGLQPAIAKSSAESIRIVCMVFIFRSLNT